MLIERFYEQYLKRQIDFKTMAIMMAIVTRGVKSIAFDELVSKDRFTRPLWHLAGCMVERFV